MKMVKKICVIYGSYRKIEAGVLLFWTTLYVSVSVCLSVSFSLFLYSRIIYNEFYGTFEVCF